MVYWPIGGTGIISPYDKTMEYKYIFSRYLWKDRSQLPIYHDDVVNLLQFLH